MDIVIVAKTMMTMMTKMTNLRTDAMLKYCLENNVCYKKDSSAPVLRCMQEDNAVILEPQLESFVCNEDVTKDINDDQRDDPEDDQGDDPVCNDDQGDDPDLGDGGGIDPRDDDVAASLRGDKDFRTRQWTFELVIQRRMINKKFRRYICEIMKQRNKEPAQYTMSIHSTPRVLNSKMSKCI